MASGPVATVMAGSSGGGKRDVEACGSCYGDRNLTYLNGVSESGTEVIIFWGYEYLAFTGQAAKGLGMVDAVQVALKTGSERVWLLDNSPVSCSLSTSCERRELVCLERFPLSA